MKKPFVSVVVPMYNSQETIESCLNSLVNLDYPKDRYEIIVVDDHSTDDSVKIVREFANVYDNIRLLNQKIGKKGPAAARNLGIKSAKGEFIASTDSDCIVPKNWILSLTKPLITNKRVCAVGGPLYSPESGNFFNRINSIFSNSKGNEALLSAPNSAFRKESILKLGLFDEDLISGEDPDLIWRMEKEGYKIIFIQNLGVTHNHKINFMSFIKRHVWYGQGRVLLAKKHPEKFGFAEKHFLWAGFIVAVLSFILISRNSAPLWTLVLFLSFMLFSFARRANLLVKIAKRYSFINSIKGSLLFPVIDMANLYGMTKQKLGLK